MFDLKDRLKEYRTLCGLSQQDVADSLNIHRSTYSYYELGKTEPSLENICTLSRLFGVSLNEMLGMQSDASVAVYDGEAATGETMRVGDLSREEKLLVMRYRLLTSSQRQELLSLMLTSDDLRSEETEE